MDELKVFKSGIMSRILPGRAAHTSVARGSKISNKSLTLFFTTLLQTLPLDALFEKNYLYMETSKTKIYISSVQINIQ